MYMFDYRQGEKHGPICYENLQTDLHHPSPCVIMLLCKMDKERKQTIVQEYRLHEGDTGSPEVQVALLTERINALTEHMKVHRHDYHTLRGLMMMVGQRQRLLKYLKDADSKRYRTLISRLGLRK